jgi:hypothetical protein
MKQRKQVFLTTTKANSPLKSKASQWSKRKTLEARATSSKKMNLSNLRTSLLLNQKMKRIQMINLVSKVLKRKTRKKNKNPIRSSLSKISSSLIKFKASNKKIQVKMCRKNRLNLLIKNNKNHRKMKSN